MRYAAELIYGQHLIVENDAAESTLVTLSSSSEGQQQSQRIGFNTGKWSSAPALFRLENDYILRVNTSAGARFITVRGNQVRSLQGAPDMDEAEEIPMKGGEARRGAVMEPMPPLAPMEPMKPLQPLNPMEMRTGNMRMSMGSDEKAGESERRFCTQCGQPIGRGDRFCAYCGAKVAGIE